jgi:hypothetical protein
MRTIYILFFLTFFCKIVAQDLEKIKKADTIYIYFKEDKIKQIHHIETSRNQDKKYDNYFFDYSNEQIAFQFSNRTTLNNVRKENKKFLKKNKDIILNYDFIKKVGNLNIAEMIGSFYYAKKVVYVIDDNDIGCFKISLKEVSIVGPVRFSEE